MTTRSLNKIKIHYGKCPVMLDAMPGGYQVWHVYPYVNRWPAGHVSDTINPRSHNENVLESPVAATIRRTLTDDPANFVLANRGILLLASKVCRNYATECLEVEFDTDHSALKGLADGGTTDAVLADALALCEDDAAWPDKAAIHIEIVEGLNDADRVALMVEGRNTSRQVRSSSLVNASGRFDWLKAALPAEMVGRIAWEENSEGVAVSDVLAAIGIFRPGLGRPIEEHEHGTGHLRHTWSERNSEHKDWMARAASMYRDRSKLAASLRDDEVLKDFQSVAPLATSILTMYDDICLALAKDAEAKSAKTRSATKHYRWEKAFPLAGKSPWLTPYTRRPSNRKVPAGWVFPVLAAARQYMKNGNWHKPSMKPGYWEEFIDGAIHWAEMRIKDGWTAEKYGKSELTYDCLYTHISVSRMRAKEIETVGHATTP